MRSYLMNFMFFSNSETSICILFIRQTILPCMIFSQIEGKNCEDGACFIYSKFPTDLHNISYVISTQCLLFKWNYSVLLNDTDRINH